LKYLKESKILSRTSCFMVERLYQYSSFQSFLSGFLCGVVWICHWWNI